MLKMALAVKKILKMMNCAEVQVLVRSEKKRELCGHLDKDNVVVF